MAKLYWRIKLNDKWTWVAATEENTRWDNDSFPDYIGPAHKILGFDYNRYDGDAQELYTEKPEVISHLWDVSPGEEE